MSIGDDKQQTPINRLRSIFQENLHIPEEDLELIDFTYAVFVSNPMPGDPLWGLVVDASGGGKTELLRSLRGKKDAFFLSKLSAKTLKSGYRDPKRPKEDPSLLPKLDGKVLIIKDLSPLLSMDRTARNTIVGDLRDAYDGFTDDGFGNVGHVSYESRFSVLAASTLAIEQFDRVDQELGERFVKIRARGKDNRSKVRRAITNVGMDNDWRGAMEASVDEFLESLPPTIPLDISVELSEALTILADFTATARSHVPRDRNHELVYLPRPEVGTRLAKELSKLLLALAYIRGKTTPDVEDFATVCRVAEDCLPPNRHEVLLALAGRRRSPLPDSTKRGTLSDLEVLGILDSNSEITEKWRTSLGEVSKLLHSRMLPERAALGVSGFFSSLVEYEAAPPSHTARSSLLGGAFNPRNFS